MPPHLTTSSSSSLRLIVLYNLLPLSHRNLLHYTPISHGGLHLRHSLPLALTCMIRKIDAGTGITAVPNLAQTRPIEAVAPAGACRLLWSCRSDGHKLFRAAPH